MKSLLAVFILLCCCLSTRAADTKKSLIGQWTDGNGIGIEFKANGDFSREATVGGHAQRVGSGHWQLTSDATGVRALFADATTLILTYTDGHPTEVWRVTVKKEPFYNDKETLRLTPIDGSTLTWGGYYFRAP